MTAPGWTRRYGRPATTCSANAIPTPKHDAPSTSVTWADALAHLAELGLSALDRSLDKRRPADHYQVLLHLNGDNGQAQRHMGDLVPDV